MYFIFALLEFRDIAIVNKVLKSGRSLEIFLCSCFLGSFALLKDRATINLLRFGTSRSYVASRVHCIEENETERSQHFSVRVPMKTNQRHLFWQQ